MSKARCDNHVLYGLWRNSLYYIITRLHHLYNLPTRRIVLLQSFQPTIITLLQIFLRTHPSSLSIYFYENTFGRVGTQASRISCIHQQFKVIRSFRAKLERHIIATVKKYISFESFSVKRPVAFCTTTIVMEWKQIKHALRRPLTLSMHTTQSLFVMGRYCSCFLRMIDLMTVDSPKWLFCDPAYSNSSCQKMDREPWPNQ